MAWFGSVWCLGQSHLGWPGLGYGAQPPQAYPSAHQFSAAFAMQQALHNPYATHLPPSLGPADLHQRQPYPGGPCGAGLSAAQQAGTFMAALGGHVPRHALPVTNSALPAANPRVAFPRELKGTDTEHNTQRSKLKAAPSKQVRVPSSCIPRVLASGKLHAPQQLPMPIAETCQQVWQTRDCAASPTTEASGGVAPAAWPDHLPADAVEMFDELEDVLKGVG